MRSVGPERESSHGIRRLCRGRSGEPVTGRYAGRGVHSEHVRYASWCIPLSPVTLLAGCAGPPTINVVGSYFPAWMLCTLIGLLAAVCLRQALVLCRLEELIILPLVTHAAVALAVTLAVWLLWFGH